MGPKKKQVGALSLRERLDRFAQNPESDVELANIAKEAWEASLESYKYDKAAPSTKKRRDRHLKEFEDYITGIAKLEDNDPITEDRLWGKPFVEANMRAWLRFAAKEIMPRSYQSESIKFNTLLQRRQSIMYWVSQKCKDNVSRKDMWRASNEALYHSYRAENIATAAEAKIYLTKLDMMNLLEHSQYISYNADNAQQQHITWLLSYVCGVRPGTIGTARYYGDQYLRWEDLKVKRVGGGNFSVEVLFKYLKGYRNEIIKPLRFTIGAPEYADDILYSLGHRILALALRRGYLADYKTVEDLYKDTKVNIAFKPECLKLPVVCASSPKGLEVDLNTAASSNAISCFMTRAALDFGLPPGITLYAWRRSAGTNVANAKSNDVARGMLGHEMLSRTFETSYQQGSIALDVLSIAMGRTTKTIEQLIDNVVVNRVQILTENKDKWVKKFITEDEAYVTGSDNEQQARLAAENDPTNNDLQQALDTAVRTLHNTRRTLRIQGQLAFHRFQLQETASAMTTEEIQRRTEEATKPGQVQALVQEVAKVAREQALNDEKQLRIAAASARKDVESLTEEDAQDDFAAEDFVDARNGGEQIESLEDFDEDEARVVERAGFEGRSRADERQEEAQDTGVSPEAAQAAEKKAIEAGGKALIEHLVQDGGKFKGDLTCRLCELDDTVPDTVGDEDEDEEVEGEEAAEEADESSSAAKPRPKGKGKASATTAAPAKAKAKSTKRVGNYKTKLWKAGKLKEHLAQEFHSPKAKFLRQYKDSSSTCPFGDDDNPCKTVGTGHAILKHCFETTSQSDEHLLKAAKAGLFSRDFDPKLVRGASVRTVSKQGDGRASYAGADDPASVDLKTLVHPRNLTAAGEVNITPASKKKDKTVLRLPTKDPLTETALWKSHEEGIYGARADIIQKQLKIIASSTHVSLSQHETKANEEGGTSGRRFVGKAKSKGIATLRARLEELNFAWAESVDDAENANADMADEEAQEEGGAEAEAMDET